MRFIDADAVARRAPYGDAVEALRRGFARGCVSPKRAHHSIAVPGGAPGTLLMMPAWQSGGVLGVKLATVFPDNNKRGQEAVQASYLLLDATSGVALAMLDGGELTARRTAATSALAADYLAKPDAKRLLLVGTGRIARHAGACYAALRPALDDIAVWGRNADHAAALAETLARSTGRCAQVVADLEQAAREADIIACATLSQTPLIHGAWLRPGSHLDLIGGYTPQMREADDDAAARARVFVDTREGALAEAGDILGPLASGALTAERIGDLAALCRGEAQGRISADEITLFKSVGSALADLAVAEMIWRAG